MRTRGHRSFSCMVWALHTVDTNAGNNLEVALNVSYGTPSNMLTLLLLTWCSIRRLSTSPNKCLRPMSSSDSLSPSPSRLQTPLRSSFQAIPDVSRPWRKAWPAWCMSARLCASRHLMFMKRMRIAWCIDALTWFYGHALIGSRLLPLANYHNQQQNKHVCICRLRSQCMGKSGQIQRKRIKRGMLIGAPVVFLYSCCHVVPCQSFLEDHEYSLILRTLGSVSSSMVECK